MSQAEIVLDLESLTDDELKAVLQQWRDHTDPDPYVDRLGGIMLLNEIEKRWLGVDEQGDAEQEFFGNGL